MEITFFKGGNTTKRNHVGTLIQYESVTLSGELKQEQDISNPIVIIDLSPTGIYTGDTTYIQEFKTNFYSYTCTYIPLFKRYYRVTKITVIRNNIISFSLHVDVLLSFYEFIRSQKAFVTRNTNNYNIQLPDERRVIKNTFTISEFKPTNVSGGLVNITFSPNPNTYHITAYIYSQSGETYRNTGNFNLTLDTNDNITDLTISESFNANIGATYVLSNSMAGRLAGWCFYDENIRTFVGGMYAYPFEIPERLLVTDPTLPIIPTETVRVNGNPLSDGSLSVSARRAHFNMSDELVLADFVINTNTGGEFEIKDFNDLEPYSNYQLYIPYYGWWDLPFNQLLDKRIVVYYLVNFKNGSATVQVLNKTDNIIVFSSTCQLGVEVEKSASNLVEVTDKARQNDMNLTLSLIGSAITLGGSIATLNPIGIGLGVAHAGATVTKAIAQYSETQKTNYSKAYIGNSGNVTPLFNYQEIKIRKTKQDIQYSLTTDFLNYNGGITNQLLSLSNIHGYTEIGEIEYDFSSNVTIQPTETELNEITTYLKNGVYFS